MLIAASGLHASLKNEAQPIDFRLSRRAAEGSACKAGDLRLRSVDLLAGDGMIENDRCVRLRQVVGTPERAKNLDRLYRKVSVLLRLLVVVVVDEFSTNGDPAWLLYFDRKLVDAPPYPWSH